MGRAEFNGGGDSVGDGMARIVLYGYDGYGNANRQGHGHGLDDMGKKSS